MESQARKQWLESSGWIKVDDGTYQLREDLERSRGQTTISSLNFFLSLVQAAAQLRSSEPEEQP